MAVGTLTLSDFLLARIAEDEQWVRDAGNDFASTPDGSARILAECGAKRRIVVMLGDYLDDTPSADMVDRIRVVTVKLLALPYADHPDYNPEWRP